MARIGTVAKRKPRRLTFAEVRAKIKLPYEPAHRSEEEIRAAVLSVLQKNNLYLIGTFAF